MPRRSSRLSPRLLTGSLAVAVAASLVALAMAGPAVARPAPAAAARSTDHAAASKTKPAPKRDPNAMPVGNLPDWQQVMAENFNTPVARGDWPGAYKGLWSSYSGFHDTSGIGYYDPKQTLSVGSGRLNIYLHTVDGVPLGAAPEPWVDAKPTGQIYGRYSIRFQGPRLPDYGVGWLLWPDSNIWKQGEIDFPESSLTGHMMAFDHELGDPSHNAMVYDTEVGWGAWHTATIDWTPSGVTYYLDGKKIAFCRVSPDSPMHLVLATATNGHRPPASVAGHVLIDWVTIYRWTGPR